jgi:ribonuclease HII
MSLALSKLSAETAIIDGNMTINTLLPQFTIVKGDSKYLEIAAASILAKVYRDHLMKELGRKYQGYGLELHSGYPTKSHRAAIATLGPSRIHRRSFNLLGKTQLEGIKLNEG